MGDPFERRTLADLYVEHGDDGLRDLIAAGTVQLAKGDTVRAFDPRTLGVVKQGTIVSVGPKYARVDFGLSGIARVPRADVLERI